MRKATVVVLQDDPYNSMFEIMLEDLFTIKDVYFVIEKDFPEYGIYSFLPSRKLKTITFGLSTCIYSQYYKLPKLLWKLRRQYEHISVLLFNSSLIKPKYPIEIFSRLKRIASFNLFYLDVYNHSWVCSYANYLLKNNIFEKVFSIDPNDAYIHNMTLKYTPYSVKSIDNINKRAPYLYFCGSDMGRAYLLFNIWKESRNRDVKVIYDLARAEKIQDFFEADKDIHFIDHMPYSEVLQKSVEASCILDVVQKGQIAFTLRVYEAVVYNKKLLTNNEEIINFEYYDDRYMKYFDSVNDIDWDWINADIEINYGYEGDFSPINLIEELA